MAVEKMVMVNIIGDLAQVDQIAKGIVLSSVVHMVNAVTEIQNINFPILNARDDVDAMIDFNFVRPYTSKKDLPAVQKKLEALMDIFDLPRREDEGDYRLPYDFAQDREQIERLYETVADNHQQLLRLTEENARLTELQKYLDLIKSLPLDLNLLLEMQFFRLRLGKITKYNMEKLKQNYENIPAIACSLSREGDTTYVLLVVPQPVEIEVNRVLASLNFAEYQIPLIFHGKPAVWLAQITARQKQIQQEIEFVKAQLQDIKQKYSRDILAYYSRLQMEYLIEELKGFIACSRAHFYLTGWLPVSRKSALLKELAGCKPSPIITFQEAKDVQEGLTPPTSLKNGYLLKPFESLVKMYGVPAYNELDPTAFVGLSYMFLFGAMFGDVGQGLILFIIGEILNRFYRRPNLGGILARLGLSSVLFGFLYGSVFGFEDVLPTYIVKPMANINVILIAAVIMGILLLTVGFVYNLANSLKNRDLESGVFSRNGLAGLLFYWLLLYWALSNVLRWETVLSGKALLMAILFLAALMFFRQPLANWLAGKRPLYQEPKADYYMEGGFGILETFLNMFTNTLSFVRVGAFAINHVGLFIAFQTLAQMISNSFGSVLLLVCGNIIIIGLEGLIVFIQGLRLEYYEIFSKFFQGAGYEYHPFRIPQVPGQGAAVSRLRPHMARRLPERLPVN